MVAELATTIHFVGECPDVAKCDYVHKTLGLLSDGPHITAEAVVDLVEALALGGIGYVWGRRKWRKEHAQFDAEHNIHHDRSVQ